MPKTQYTSRKIEWRPPLDLAAQINEPYWVLLHSGVRAPYSGRYSYLACSMREQIIAADFSGLAAVLTHDKPLFENSWFGYLGYGLKNTLEKLENDAPGWLYMPPLNMMRFGNIYQFDHDTQTLTLWSDGRDAPITQDRTSHPPAIPPARITGSNIARSEYLEKAKHVIERIQAGDLYQANLTRKFYGEFSSAPDYFQLFRKLCSVSPAAYSAFMRLGDVYILSSSPESFMNIDASGNVTTRPIKGTAPRGNDPVSDERNRQKLIASGKDRAENLMIVDLMRNDLAKACETGSVKTETLFDVTTHATIHHLSSTIKGKKLTGSNTLDVIRAAFPPGSMTGAPKISAMNLCSKLEGRERGIYSGAIGWFGGDGSCDLSVVIRTLVIKGNKFEFQVGGGIVADSTPRKELEELISKARGMLLALDIPTSEIEII